MKKIFNFSPGPSKLPQSVIDKVEKSVNNYNNSGKSILEISHRSIEFEKILNEINNNFYELFNLPKDINILLLQGGATYQNSLIPMNIEEEKTLGCFVTGTWGKKTSEDFLKIFEGLNPTVKDGEFLLFKNSYLVSNSIIFFLSESYSESLTLGLLSL